MTPEVRFRLEDMLGGASTEQVLADRRLALALTHIVQIVGEAAFKIPKDFRDSCPGLPWGPAIGQRHIIVHGYGKVRTEDVVSTVRINFPDLISVLQTLLAETK